MLAHPNSPSADPAVAPAGSEVAESESTLLPVLPEPWTLLECIGSGAFSSVFKVRHEILGAVYALKVLRTTDNSLQRRTLQEGRIQAQLAHDHIVRVHDALLIQGQLGLVMEYVDGCSLAEFLQAENGLLSEVEALALFRQVLRGVGAAHRHGVLHRDLKPENILLVGDRSSIMAKVTDFGFAKARDSELNGMTRDGSVLGTPGYMAPEQRHNPARADQRCDIFSLGAILYELVTGHPAFGRKEDWLETAKAVDRGTYAPPSELRAGLSHHVENAIHVALSLDPAGRFASCEDFDAALFGATLDEAAVDTLALEWKGLVPLEAPPPSMEDTVEPEVDSEPEELNLSPDFIMGGLGFLAGGLLVGLVNLVLQ